MSVLKIAVSIGDLLGRIEANVDDRLTVGLLAALITESLSSEIDLVVRSSNKLCLDLDDFDIVELQILFGRDLFNSCPNQRSDHSIFQ